MIPHLVCQGNDVGTQYRSEYVYSSEQRQLAEASRDTYQQALNAAGYGTITTEMIEAPVLPRRKLPSAVPC